MKITTEKLPRSMLALDIELDPAQVEKGLDRAARRLSEKYTVPGFRKGKAPRFIIENYFGRAALMEEAREDLINRAFKQAIQQEQIKPFGPANLESVDPTDAFRFRVTVPMPPSVTLPDYRAMRLEPDIPAVTDEMVQQGLNARRDRHVVLQELDEPRPAQEGDQLTVKMKMRLANDDPAAPLDEDEPTETTLVLEPGQAIEEFYAGLTGASVGETREVTARLPETYPDEQLRGQEAIFTIEVVGMQQRLLPEWDEVPLLEEVGATLDDLRADTRQVLETNARIEAETSLVDAFVRQIVAETSYDIPDILVQDTAEGLLKSHLSQYEQYGITPEQVLEYSGRTREDALAALQPSAEEHVKTNLMLQEVIEREALDISDAELQGEAARALQLAGPRERQALNEQGAAQQFLSNVANTVLNRKLRERLLAIATGTVADVPAPHETDAPTEVDAAAAAALPPQPDAAAAGEPDEESTTDTDVRASG